MQTGLTLFFVVCAALCDPLVLSNGKILLRIENTEVTTFSLNPFSVLLRTNITELKSVQSGVIRPDGKYAAIYQSVNNLHRITILDLETLTKHGTIFRDDYFVYKPFFFSDSIFVMSRTMYSQGSAWTKYNLVNLSVTEVMVDMPSVNFIRVEGNNAFFQSCMQIYSFDGTKLLSIYHPRCVNNAISHKYAYSTYSEVINSDYSQNKIISVSLSDGKMTEVVTANITKSPFAITAIDENSDPVIAYVLSYTVESPTFSRYMYTGTYYNGSALTPHKNNPIEFHNLIFGYSETYALYYRVINGNMIYESQDPNTNRRVLYVYNLLTGDNWQLDLVTMNLTENIVSTPSVTRLPTNSSTAMTSCLILAIMLLLIVH
jgi:hypothetical protein